MMSKESLHLWPPRPHLLKHIYGIFLFSLALCLFCSDHESPQSKVISYCSRSIRRGLCPKFLLLGYKYYLDGNAEPTMFMTLVEKYALLCKENFDLNENVEWFVWKRRTLSTVSIFPRKISEGSLQNPEILVKSKSIQQSALQSKTKDNIVCIPRADFLPPRNSLETLFCRPALVRALIPEESLLRLCVKKKSVSNRR